MRKTLFPLIAILLAAFNQSTSKETASTNDTASSNTTSSVNNAAKQVPAGPVPNTIMTEAYVKNLAASIYAWGWPMINIHNRYLLFAQLKEPVYGGGVLPLAPPSRMCMLTDYVRPRKEPLPVPTRMWCTPWNLWNSQRTRGDTGSRF